MKKLLLVLLALSLLLALASCTTNNKGTTNKFIPLSDDQVLVVGSTQRSFMNYEIEREMVSTLTYQLSATYTLRRTYSSYVSDAVLYEGYYYYWEADTQTETETLGTATTKKTYTYAYLPIVENEKVAVKATTHTQVTYDYKGGWVEKDVAVNIELNGYFASFSALEEACPELAEKIDTKPTRKYYIDTTTPNQITTDESSFDSYYYIEEK